MEHQQLTEPSPTEQPYLARRQNWTNQLARHALMQPDATALRFLGHTTTWADLDRRVTALAGALSRRGVGFGDRVLILMLNRTEFIESFLAANKLGAIAVPVNFRMTPPEIAFLVSDCQARVVITEAVLAKVATAVRDIDPTLQTVIVAGGGTDDEVIGYDDLIAEPGDAPQSGGHPQRLACADHVHLRHHGQAQGRGAHARQHRRPGDDQPVHDRRRHQPTTSGSSGCRCSTSQASAT